MSAALGRQGPSAVEAVQALVPDWWLVHPAGPGEVAALRPRRRGGPQSRLRNLAAGEIAHFRAHVEVVDLIGIRDTRGTDCCRSCAARDPGPAPRPPGGLAVLVQRAAPAGRTVGDLVVHADASRRLLVGLLRNGCGLRLPAVRPRLLPGRASHLSRRPHPHVLH